METSPEESPDLGSHQNASNTNVLTTRRTPYRDNENDDDEGIDALNENPFRSPTDDPEEKEIVSNIPSLVAAFSASLTTGATTYSFGLYGAELQKRLHLTQGQVDTISTAFFFAGLFSFIPGMCSDRYGTKAAITSGGIIGSINLLLYWGVAREYFDVPHGLIVPALSILGINTYLSSALVTGGVFKTITIACGAGKSKGSAVGIAKGYVGLGSGLYVAIFESLRKPGETKLDFLPMAAFFCIFAASTPAFIFLPSKDRVSKVTFRDDTTPKHFLVLYASLLCMILFIVGNSMAELFEGHHDHEVDQHFSDEPLRPPKNHKGMALLLTSIWLGPILLWFVLPKKVYNSVGALSGIPVSPSEEEAEEASTNTGEVIDTTTTNNNGGLISRTSQLDDGEEDLSLLEASDNEEPEQIEDEPFPDDESPTSSSTTSSSDSEYGRERNQNLYQMLRTTPALLMLWTTTILVGAGTLESNNMGQMVEALGFDPEVTPASLALFSVSQAIARVATGALSESALLWRNVSCGVGGGVKGVPRPFFFVLASCLGLFSHIVLGLATTENVFVAGAALSGAAFGMVWPLLVLIIGEVFGPLHMGGNYMFYDGFTSAAGTMFVSKIVAQDVYEAHIPPPNHQHLNMTDADGNFLEASSKDDDDLTCYGPGCFQMTHWIVAALSVTCIATSIAMMIVTRKIYRQKLKVAQQHDHSH